MENNNFRNFRIPFPRTELIRVDREWWIPLTTIRYRDIKEKEKDKIGLLYTKQTHNGYHYQVWVRRSEYSSDLLVEEDFSGREFKFSTIDEVIKWVTEERLPIFGFE